MSYDINDLENVVVPETKKTTTTIVENSREEFMSLFTDLDKDTQWIVEALRDASGLKMMDRSADGATFLMVTATCIEDASLIHGYFTYETYRTDLQNLISTLNAGKDESEKARYNVYLDVYSMCPDHKEILRNAWTNHNPGDRAKREVVEMSINPQAVHTNDFTMTGLAKCTSCLGTGMYNEDKGQICFRCQGKGTTTSDDRYRNSGYDNFKANK